MKQQSIDALAQELLDFLETYNLFGEYLKSAIEGSTLTASKLAQALDITPAAVSQWCSGKRLPDSGIVFIIAKRLGMDPSEQKGLMTAWNSTRFFHGYISYLQKAISQNDIEIIEAILEQTMEVK